MWNVDDVRLAMDISNSQIQDIEKNRELLDTLHSCILCHSVCDKDSEMCVVCGGYKFTENIVQVMADIELTMGDNSPIPNFRERL